jgi:hypothetical protein
MPATIAPVKFVSRRRTSPRHLARLARSILDQTSDDYEWVIVPNGGIGASDIDQVLREVAAADGGKR